MKILDFGSMQLANDKVLIPMLVTGIVVYGMTVFDQSVARDLALTGLGYLAGATQGSKGGSNGI